MKLKEKKTLGYAIFSIVVIVLLSFYLGKTDYNKINEANKKGLADAKDNSVKIAKKLKEYIYEVVDSTPNIKDVVTLNKEKVSEQVKDVKKITFGNVTKKSQKEEKVTDKKTKKENLKEPVVKKSDSLPKPIENQTKVDDKSGSGKNIDSESNKKLRITL